MADFQIRIGDSREVLKDYPDNHFDSVVCDPPYALESVVKRFGGKDAAPAKFGKDGAFSRQSKGFMGQTWDTGETAFDPEFWQEVMRVMKPGAHLLAFSGSRTYHRLATAVEMAGFEIRDQIMWLYGSGFPKSHDAGDGWGSALKPAHEPIVMARKMFRGTIKGCVEKWGTGGINIDGCRVEGEPWKAHQATGLASVKSFTKGSAPVIEKSPHDLGRFPANVIHDGSDEVLDAFPDSNGSGKARTLNRGTREDSGWGMQDAPGELRDAGSGSAARFFYCAKASKADRGADNNHPTVKPTDLMRYLCRLVTPPGGTVLDPFMGSGSTGNGALLEGFNFVGIEMSEDYARIAETRLLAALPLEDLLA